MASKRAAKTRGGTGAKPKNPAGPRRAQTTAQAGKIIGCSPQNIGYWCRKRGAPHDRGPGNAIKVDAEELRRWLKDNRIDNAQGGDRSRPPGQQRPDVGNSMGDAPAAAQGAGPGSAGDPDMPAEVLALIAFGREKLDRLLIAQKILTEQMEREVVARTLVKADEARAAWTRAARSAGNLLRSLVESLPGALLASVGVENTPAAAAAMRRVLEQRIDGVCERLASGMNLDGDAADSPGTKA